MLPLPALRNVSVLALCQALAMTCSALVISITALVGQSLAPDPGMATVPLALQFLGLMATSPGASHFMRRFGRRAGFTLGAGIGILAGLLGVHAIRDANFALYCVAAAMTGAFLAHAMYYRFAAADAVEAPYRSRAISLVMAGGVLAAVLGPQLANWSKDLFAPVTFAGGYLVLAGLCAGQLVIVQFARMPASSHEARQHSGRPLKAILRQPALPVAILCGMAAYGGMNLVMSVTPPAMLACNHGFDGAAFVIQWHVFAMFAPSFFTGHLIHRFGVRRVIAVGAVMMLGTVATNLSGEALVQFLGALVLLGVGWNFMFVGATTWVTQLHAAEEKAKVQAVNDVLVFGTVGLTAVASGWTYANLGWTAVNLAIVLPLVLVLALLALAGRGEASVEAEAPAE